MTDQPIQKWDPKWLSQRGNQVTEITPEIAGQLLERNTANRPPKPRMIKQFARDMEAGKWDPDASDIKIAATGELVDGQNRLLACLLAGVPFPTLVRFGVSTASKRHVDTGTKRTVADMLSMEGITSNTTAVAAAISLRIRYTTRVEQFGGKRAVDTKGINPLTHEEILVYLNEHPSLRDFATIAGTLRAQMPAIPSSSFLAGLSLMAETDAGADGATKFADQLVTGDFGGPGDPMQALVAYAAMQRANSTGSPGYKGRMGQEAHLLAFIKVWNAWRKGQKIERRIIVKITDKLVLPV